jgi:Kyakuja-Dileera-Zisupton transposase
MQKRRRDDVWLTNGEGMMTARARYHAHLAVAVDTHDVCPQTFRNISNWPLEQVDPEESHFRAISEAHSASKLKDVNGIVVHACARHGAYCPGSLVDLPKGEKQASVDWSFCEACQTINFIGLLKLMLIYDIMCQYWKRLALRIGRNDHLTLPQMQLEKAIGLFHVHGHKPACLFRYASTFIPGAAICDGEILETDWAVLNRISKSLRTATLAHRAEVLDDHMNDHNWKKLVGIGKFAVYTHPEYI